MLEGDQDYRVVAQDVTMPQVDGLEGLRRLRETGDETPIVLMSGFSSREAAPAGHDAYFLQKPFEASQLVDAAAAAQFRQQPDSLPEGPCPGLSADGAA